MDIVEMAALVSDMDKACSVDGDANWELLVSESEAALLIGVAAGMLREVIESMMKQ